MKQRFRLGHFRDIEVTAEASSVWGVVGLWALFGFLGRSVFGLRTPVAVVGGALAMLMHFASELMHQFGHARAASQVGYPMQRVHLWGVLGTSVYPADEPPLPETVHIVRALGGPRTSVWLALVGALIAILVRPVSRLAFMVASLFGLENLLIFAVGALLPLPFMETDGTTIRRYRNARERRNIVIQE